MRIVIEIEEERYNYVKNQVKGGIDNPLKVIIANGIPLTTVKPQPCTDAVSRQAVLEYIEGSDADLWHDSENELVRQDIRELPSVEPKPCDDCISRQAVLDYIYNDLGLGDEKFGNDVERQVELDRSYRYVKSLSPVAPQPKLGKWISLDDFRGKCNENGFMCSECGEHSDYEENFCSYCGAKMQEVEVEE